MPVSRLRCVAWMIESMGLYSSREALKIESDVLIYIGNRTNDGAFGGVKQYLRRKRCLYIHILPVDMLLQTHCFTNLRLRNRCCKLPAAYVQLHIDYCVAP